MRRASVIYLYRAGKRLVKIPGFVTIFGCVATFRDKFEEGKILCVFIL